MTRLLPLLALCLALGRPLDWRRRPPAAGGRCLKGAGLDGAKAPDEHNG